MFLHLSVILYTGGCKPLGKHPPGETPPTWADTPSPGKQPPPKMAIEAGGTVRILLKRILVLNIVTYIGGSRGGREGRTPPPGRPNSFDFMQFSGKFGVFTPPLEGSRPPRENPGSATDLYTYIKDFPDGGM